MIDWIDQQLLLRGRKDASIGTDEYGNRWSIWPSGDALYEVKLQRACPEGETILTMMKKFPDDEDRRLSDEWHRIFSHTHGNDFALVDDLAIGKLLAQGIADNRQAPDVRQFFDLRFTFRFDHKYSTAHDSRFPPTDVVRNVRFYSWKLRDQRGWLSIMLEEGRISVNWEPGGKYTYPIFDFHTSRVSADWSHRIPTFFPDYVTNALDIAGLFVVEVLVPWVEGQDMRKRYNRGRRLGVEE